jgi:hypothetical protein
MLPRFLYAAPAWFIWDPSQSLQYGLSAATISVLRGIQTECMLFASGGQTGTSGLVLQGEVHVFDIALHLYTQSMSHRTKQLMSPFYDSLSKQRSGSDIPTPYTENKMAQHPYHQLAFAAGEHDKKLPAFVQLCQDCYNQQYISVEPMLVKVSDEELTKVLKKKQELIASRTNPSLGTASSEDLDDAAKEEMKLSLSDESIEWLTEGLLAVDLDDAQRWAWLKRKLAYDRYIKRKTEHTAKSKNRTNLIKSYWQVRLMELCAERFEEYKRRRRWATQSCELGPLATRISLDHHTLSTYLNLDRPQSTMGLNIRSRNIQLNCNPRWRRSPLGAGKNVCPCSHNNHTPEHLFFYCPLLDVAREYLVRETNGCRRLEVLMTKYIDVATSWAIQYFGIPAFDMAKQWDKHQFPRLRGRAVT